MVSASLVVNYFEITIFVCRKSRSGWNGWAFVLYTALGRDSIRFDVQISQYYDYQKHMMLSLFIVLRIITGDPMSYPTSYPGLAEALSVGGYLKLCWIETKICWVGLWDEGEDTNAADCSPRLIRGEWRGYTCERVGERAGRRMGRRVGRPDKNNGLVTLGWTRRGCRTSVHLNTLTTGDRARASVRMWGCGCAKWRGEYECMCVPGCLHECVSVRLWGR